MSYEKRQREANEAARKYLREQHPDAPWDAIDDLSRALTHELYYGPMPYGYWSDKEGGDALCVQPWPGWVGGCKMLSELIEVLPIELWYCHDCGSICETDPWQDQSNWERECEGHPNDGTGDCDGTCVEPSYIGPDDVQTVPTIEALFDKELWRYLT